MHNAHKPKRTKGSTLFSNLGEYNDFELKCYIEGKRMAKIFEKMCILDEKYFMKVRVVDCVVCGVASAKSKSRPAACDDDDYHHRRLLSQPSRRNNHCIMQ